MNRDMQAVRINWRRRWSHMTAVRYLMLEGAHAEDYDTKNTLKEAVSAFLRFGDEGLLGECIPVAEERAALLGKLHPLKVAIGRHGISFNQELLPVLWLRLFQREPISVTSGAVQSFAKWRWNACRKGQTWMLLHSNADGDWVGKRRTPAPEPKLIGLFLDEILMLEMQDDWYRLDWRMLLRPKIGERKSRPSVANAKRVAGAGVVAVLKPCLAQLAAKANSADIFESGSGLESSLSLDEVVQLLRDRFPTARRYRASTIKRALPALIKCPRGRPPLKVKPR